MKPFTSGHVFRLVKILRAIQVPRKEEIGTKFSNCQAYTKGYRDREQVEI